MRIWGAILLMLAVVSCSENSWELTPVNSSPKVEENLFSLESNKSLILKFADGLLLEEEGLNTLELISLIQILGPSEPSQFILRNFRYNHILENGLDENKIARKKALDDFYNIKYTMLFDYRKQLEAGSSKKQALKVVEKKSMALIEGVSSFNGAELAKVIKEFIEQIDAEEFELSSEQSGYLEKLQDHFVNKQRDDYANFELLKSVQKTDHQITKLALKKPHTTHFEMDIQNLSSFEKRTKLSIYGGEIEAGPVVKFKSKGRVILHKIWSEMTLKFFSCEMTLEAVPQVLDDSSLVSVPFFKDARVVTVTTSSKIYEAAEELSNELMVKKCEEEHFSLDREALAKALEVKAGEMVFQKNAHQCEVNEDCKRWYQLSTTKAQRSDSQYLCNKGQKNFAYNSCVVAGAKGSPCRVIKDKKLISSGLGEVGCTEGLSCRQVKEEAWLSNGKIHQFATGVCR